MKLDFDLLGIDEARDLRDIFFRKYEEGSEIIITCQNITPEAQNALLKILEEPGSGLVVKFECPRPELLLPTFRSRLISLASSRSLNTDEANLDELEQKLYDEGLDKNVVLLREIIKARKLLSSPAAVPRAILDHISCIT